MPIDKRHQKKEASPQDGFATDIHSTNASSGHASKKQSRSNNVHARESITKNFTDNKAETLTADHVYQIFMDHSNPVLTDLLNTFGMTTRFFQAAGQYVTDENGKQYLDLLGAFGALNLGHNHPRIQQRLNEIKDVPNLLQPGLNSYHAELLFLLNQITPDNLKRVYLINSGTEATEAAIKLVQKATGKSVIVHAEKSFHGKTLGSLSVTGNPKYQVPFAGLLVEQPAIPYDDPDALESVLAHRNDIAAFIVEPIQGEGGINVPREDYLQRVRKICDNHGVYLIVDEIQTGLGRTGQMFASDGITPDVLLIGKSLGGGYIPVSAIITTDEIWNAAYGSIKDALLHTSTFSGNTRACAAAAETIRILMTEPLIHNARVLGDYFLSGLRALKEKHPIIQDVRGKGLMIGLELRKPFLGNLMTDNYLGQIVAGQLYRDYNIITSFTLNQPKILRFEPPLTITKKDIDYALKSIDDLFTRVPKPEYHVASMVAFMSNNRSPELIRMGAIIGGKTDPVDMENAQVNIFADDLLQDPSLLSLQGKYFSSIEESRKNLVASVYNNADREINRRALQSAYAAAEYFSRVPIKQRHDALMKWSELIQDNLGELSRIGTFDGFNYQAMLWQLNTIINMLKPERLLALEEMLAPKQAFEDPNTVLFREITPGVVGISIAQNAGIVLSNLGITGAISCGKAFVLAGGTSATTNTIIKYLVKAFEETGIDPSPINLIHSNTRAPIKEWPLFGVNPKEVVVEDGGYSLPRVLTHFAYWGPRNESIMKLFNDAGIIGTYDLNGSDPIIVNHDADLNNAVLDILLRYAASGQICISPKRAIVHEKIADDLFKSLNDEIKKLLVGLVSDPTNDFMPVPGLKDRARYHEAIGEALQKGAEVYIRGEQVFNTEKPHETFYAMDYNSNLAQAGAYLAPAVIRVPPFMQLKVNTEEMFSPLLSYQTFRTVEEAVDIANSSKYGIKASIWAEDQDFIYHCIKNLQTASAYVNMPHLHLDLGSTDLGGLKDSGKNIGPEGAKYLVLEFAGALKHTTFSSKTAAENFINMYREEASLKKER